MKATVENIEKFRELFDPSLSLRKNKEVLNKNELDLSLGTVFSWRDQYTEYSKEPPTEISVTIPKELFGDVKKLVEQYNKNNK